MLPPGARGRITEAAAERTTDVSNAVPGLTSAAGRRKRALAGTSRRPRPPLPRVLAGTLIVLLLGAIVGGGFGYLYLKAYANNLQAAVKADFSAGQTELEAGKADLKKATADRAPSLIGSARSHFIAARPHFLAARDRVHRDEYLMQAEKLPFTHDYVGRLVAAVDGLSAMGVALCRASSDAADLDQLLIEPNSVQGSGGQRLLNLLRVAQPGIAKVGTSLLDAERAVNAIDPTVLPAAQRSQLSAARMSIESGLAGIDEFKTLFPAVTEILGGNGARTYLMLQVDPAELRPGGGFIGSFSVLKAEQGNLKIVQSRAIDDIDNPRPTKGQTGYTAPPAPLLEFLGNKSWVLGDTNFFPDFGRNAQAAEAAAQRQLNLKVDGVISVAPGAIAELLSVTGPLTIPGYGVTVQSQSFVQDLFDRLEGPNHKPGPDRKAFLGAVATQLMERLTNLEPAQWGPLMNSLNAAVIHKDLQVYFNAAPAQTEMDRFGWTGALNFGHPDFLMELEGNFGGTKANWYLRRAYNLTLTHSGGILHHHLTIDIVDDYRGQSVYEVEFYRAYAAVLIPSGAAGMHVQNLKADEHPFSATDLPKGSAILDGWLQINTASSRHGSWQIVVDYDTSWNGSSSAPHLLYWQKQAGAGNDPIKIDFNEDGQAHTASATLTQDLAIGLSHGGVKVEPGTIPSAHLPSLSL